MAAVALCDVFRFRQVAYIAGTTNAADLKVTVNGGAF
jgi:hypothetical protein